MKYLIVGLGNIGSEYAQTRHNIGFMVVDEIAQQQQIRFEAKRYAFGTEFKYKGRTICLIKPTTYMNLSGKAVQYWLKILKIPAQNMLVIVDDIALPFGTIRIRTKGSNAGHNGLKDIENQLQSNQYPRLRFGIGDNYSRGRQADYVLAKFTADEQAELPIFVEKSAQAVLSFCTLGASQTMNKYNQS